MELENFEAAKECLQRAVALEGTSPIPTAGAAGYLGECLRRGGEWIWHVLPVWPGWR